MRWPFSFRWHLLFLRISAIFSAFCLVVMRNIVYLQSVNHQLGHLLTDGRVKEIVIGQDYLLLSATDTNSTFTSGSSVLWLQESQSGAIYHFWSVESAFCTWQPSKLLPRTDLPHAGQTHSLSRVRVWPAKCSQNWSHESKCFGLVDTFEEPMIFLIFI